MKKKVRMNISREELATPNERRIANRLDGSIPDQVGHGGVSQKWTRRAMVMQQSSCDEGLTGRRLAGNEWQLKSKNHKRRALSERNTFNVP